MTKLTGRKAPTRWRYEYKQNGDLHVWHPATWGLREGDVAAAKAAGIRKRVSDVRRLSGGRSAATKPSDWVATPVHGLVDGKDRVTHVAIREHGALEHDAGPMWQHDCDGCIFLGRVRGIGFTTPPVDLYCHEYSGKASVLARYSSEGSDYSSTELEWVDEEIGHNLHLIEAKRRYLSR
jgi:hypothetical protein